MSIHEGNLLGYIPIELTDIIGGLCIVNVNAIVEIESHHYVGGYVGGGEDSNGWSKSIVVLVGDRILNVRETVEEIRALIEEAKGK